MKTMRAPFCARRSAATSPMPEVAPVMTTVLSFMPASWRRRSAHDVELAEEEADFFPCRLRRVRPPDPIGLDRFGEVLADAARRGLGRIGGAHHFAVPGDGVLAFEHLNHHRPAGHELDQAAKERPRLVHVVERL